MKKYTLLFGIFSFAVAGCKKPQDPITQPRITFQSISHTEVRNGSPKDTILIDLKYTMAAEGVGKDDDPTEIVFTDSRDTSLIGKEAFPSDMASNLPEGAVNINGSITLKIPAIRYLVLRPDRPDGDTLKYSIRLKDKNDNYSEPVLTPDIYILP